jgi:hypothetical protein
MFEIIKKKKDEVDIDSDDYQLEELKDSDEEKKNQKQTKMKMDSRVNSSMNRGSVQGGLRNPNNRFSLAQAHIHGYPFIDQLPRT